MRSSNPLPDPESERLAQVIAAVVDETRARYGVAVIDVAVEALGDGRHRLVGVTLLERQKSALLERLATCASAPLEDAIEALDDPQVAPLSWAVPAREAVDVRREPSDDADLSTQMVDMTESRLLWREGDWRLLQLHDLTLGWVHCDAIREVTLPLDTHPWRDVRRAVAGAAVMVEATVDRLLEAGRTRVGQPYRLGGASPTGIDCSALVQRLYAEVAGLQLPKYTGDQRRMGIRVSRSAVEPGDLLFFKSRERGFGHVALALDAGGATLLHASLGNGDVRVEPFEAVSAAYAFLGARRVARFTDSGTTGGGHVVVEVAREARAPLDLSKPETLRGYNVHVVGLAGAEGAAIARFLVHHGVAGVTAHDTSTLDTFEKNVRLSHVGLNPRERGEHVRELLSLPMRRCLGAEYLDGIEQAEVVFVPQGWFLYPSNDRLRPLRAEGGPVFSQMTELYFRLAPCPVAAVTGTNGKSTTTRLLSDLMGASSRPHLFAGNDRRNVQVLDRIETFDPRGVLVLEVSNRQLIDLSPRPHVGVITNVTPDHVEEHGSFEAYTAVKRKIVAAQRPDDIAVLNADDPISSRFDTKARVLRFSLRPIEGDGAFVDARGVLRLRFDGAEDVLLERRQLKVRGDHNVANVLAASLAARTLGVDNDTIRAVLGAFKGIALRLQHIADVDGVAYYNDVKATTPEAALAAVEAFHEPLHVIVGGGDKGLDYGRLAEAIVARARHLVVLDSPGGERVASAVMAAGNVARVSRVRDLEAAVRAAREASNPGDAVLLSPACPGMFSMFMDDAKGFNALVRGQGGEA
ncbi:MAG: UDP-N-acetylmuramoyl-L-alanine--D-glutamate ligase [Proteobacteria bacterium]|nr:UDP-N-acetylmuramoyl-L-alanine--D-glutamate ligase [Pseudomonadota bacterium]